MTLRGQFSMARDTIIDRGRGSGRQCSREQSESKPRSDTRAAPTMVTPMGRSRRHRSDEERCRRDDCKSKLSHIISLKLLRALRTNLIMVLLAEPLFSYRLN